MEADAALSDVYVDHAPAPLVLLCGVLGNMTDDEVLATVRAMATLCAEHGVVIWTRHRQSPDLTPAVRRWFGEAGFAERGFSSPGPETFVVGVHERVGPSEPLPSGERWFTFNR